MRITSLGRVGARTVLVVKGEASLASGGSRVNLLAARLRTPFAAVEERRK